MKTALTMLLLAQLLAPNSTLPQIMSAKYSSPLPIKAGRKGDVSVSFNVISGYVINREPAITLAVKPVPGIKLEKADLAASPIDKKSKDEYFVDLPILKVGVTASRAGKYELPGKLTYFFCSKADGFCSKQTVDVKIPVQVE